MHPSSRCVRDMRRALATMEVALGTRLNSSPPVVCVSADPWFRIRCGAAKLRFEMVKVRSTVEGYDELLTSMPAGEPVVIQIEKETRFFFAECRKWCGLGLPFSHLWGPKGACDSCGFLHMLQEALRSNGERDSQMAAGNAGGKRSEHENQDHGAMETPINCEIEEQRTPELLWTAGGDGGDDDLDYSDFWMAPAEGINAPSRGASSEVVDNRAFEYQLALLELPDGAASRTDCSLCGERTREPATVDKQPGRRTHLDWRTANGLP